jgi:hypothetical protein
VSARPLHSLEEASFSETYDLAAGHDEVVEHLDVNELQGID